MNHNKAEVVADLLAGSSNTHNTFVTVQRGDVVLALGSLPAHVVDHEPTPTSQFIMVRRKALIAALEAVSAEPAPSAIAESETPTDEQPNAEAGVQGSPEPSVEPGVVDREVSGD